MSSLFAPRVWHQEAGRARLSMVLDPHEPYLDHHRPGGRPLLGTALALEAMACAVQVIAPGTPVRASHVVVGEPFIVEGSRGGHVDIEVRTHPSRTGFDCVLTSAGRGPDGVAHFSATLAPATALAASAPAPAPLSQGIGADLVYAHFFHGPALRVVGRAYWQGPQLLADMAGSLANLRAAGECRTHIGPRALEFALQAAGLLLLALTGEMRIPAGIRSVCMADGDEGWLHAGCRALARMQPDGTVDISLESGAGTCVAQIEGYRTVPLPFPDGADTRARLRAGLLSTHAPILR